MTVEKFKFVCYTYFVTKSRLVQRSSTYEKKCFISYFYRYCNRFTDSGDIYKGLDFLSAHCLSCVCSINNRKQKKKAEINSNPALISAVTLHGMTAFFFAQHYAVCGVFCPVLASASSTFIILSAAVSVAPCLKKPETVRTELPKIGRAHV